MEKLNFFACIILALVSIYFVEEMVLEFLAGITAYSFSHHNLTPLDNPSVVVCFDLSDKSLDVGQNIMFNVTQSSGDQFFNAELIITVQDTDLYEIDNEFGWGLLTCFAMEPLCYWLPL